MLIFLLFVKSNLVYNLKMKKINSFEMCRLKITNSYT